ncbi:MAG: type II secretion system F family protein, partial [Nocardioidaceae bacterium]|nr:type II secretion system F family protein [Nocardioidaceae bacterium]
VCCAAAAAALLVGGSQRSRLPEFAGDPTARTAASRARVGATAFAGLGAFSGLLLIGTGSARLVALALILTAVAGAAVRLLAARQATRRAEERRRRVVELCDGLRAELAAGQSADAALDRAAHDWPLVAPAARVAAAGGDVPSALRELAVTPGAGALRIVAAAWLVAHRTGHGLADVLGRVGEDLRSSEQTRRVVLSELSSARATARLLAVLPALALAMGAGAGAAPWSFLLGTPAGLACLAGGVGLALAGLAWVEALARVQT